MMAGRTPNLDKLAAEGMLFTDYYAEASCTAGRANFITGELPIRTGMTTVGQAGASTGIPAQAVTIASALKGNGVRHRPVRQKPSRRQERISSPIGARLRRILRLWPSITFITDADGSRSRRVILPILQELLAIRSGITGQLLIHLVCDHRRRRHGGPSLGQGRQAEDRGCRNPLSQANGNRGRRNPRPCAEVH